MPKTFNIIINAKQLAYLGVVVNHEMDRGNIAQDGQVELQINTEGVLIHNAEGTLLFASQDIVPTVNIVKVDNYFDPNDPDQLLREA
jgi:hypothetical protein